jgi:hypothetical protein
MQRAVKLGLIALLLSTAVRGADLSVSQAPGAGTFPLVSGGETAAIMYDSGDYKVVEIAANMLAGDLNLVTGKKPSVIATDAAGGVAKGSAKRVVIMGTLGRSPAVDALVAAKKIDVSAIQGKWESYIVARVPDAAPGVEALAIIGSDRRGTAFGATTLSEAMGVSPWNWWADVPAKHQDNLHVTPGWHGSPSVKYRGIFLNDEDWGLQPWAAKTLEPASAGGVGDIGPRTYAKIFELLLRLKANYIWPAMHPSTKAFNIYPQNKFVADDYAIVMGSSHCEQLLRNGVSEWKDAQGRVGEAGAASYNWVTNKDGIVEYWKERLKENGKFENTYTLGLRGVHDSDMAGGGNTQQKVARLNEIYGVQRNLLKEFVNQDLNKVPQIIVPYKEALIYYQNGAVPADDVTIVWVDDNHGYIRQLSTPAEQKRSGGAGVYYHLSYWGRPHDYLWLSSTPPSLVWEELSKAHDYGARTLWVMNVGDIKPGEIGMTMAMEIAYDAGHYTVDNVGDFLKGFATRTFGAAQAGEIAAVMDSYYHLNYQRKPEHMGFNTSQNPGGPIQASEFSDEEIAQRLGAYETLVKRAEAINAALPAEYKDAYFQLVLYPVRCSAAQNEKMLSIDLGRRATARGDAAAASQFLVKARAAYDRIQSETAYYNNTLAGGKWKNMMSAAPRNIDVFRAPPAAAGPAGQAAAPPRTGGADPAPASQDAGYLSIAAERPTRNVARQGASWKVIPGLGRLGDSLAVFPTTTPSVTDAAALAANAPALEYDFTVTTANAAGKVTVQAIPTHRLNAERGLRYAVAIDGEAPQIVDLETPEFSAPWSVNVLRGSAFGTTTHNIAAGKHTLKIYMVDPGVVIDHITVDLGKLPKSYLPPAETK